MVRLTVITIKHSYAVDDVAVVISNVHYSILVTSGNLVPSAADKRTTLACKTALLILSGVTSKLSICIVQPHLNTDSHLATASCLVGLQDDAKQEPLVTYRTTVYTNIERLLM